MTDEKKSDMSGDQGQRPSQPEAQQHTQQQTYQDPQGQTPHVGYAPYGGQAPYGHQGQQHPGYGKAMGAFICGIAAIVFSMFPLIGIILGIIAIVLASQYVKAYGKDSKATAGKITGIIGVVLGVLAIIFYIMMIAFSYSYMGSGGGTTQYSSPDHNRSTPYQELSGTFESVDSIVIETLTLE